MAQQFSKVDAMLDQHPKIRRGGRNAREVFLFVLRRVAALDATDGTIPAANIEPWYLADQLMMTEEDAEDGVSRAVKAGLLWRDTDRVLVIGWDDEWAKRPLTDAERKRRQRNRSKPADVTTCHDASVTRHDTESDCPDSHGSEERRGEERREEEKPDAGASESPRFDQTLPGLGLAPIEVKAEGKRPTPAEIVALRHREVALEILAHLGGKNGVRYQGAKEHVGLIAVLLERGLSKADLIAIVDYAAAPKTHGGKGWGGDVAAQDWLRPETLFGPITHTRYLDAARSWVERRARSPTGSGVAPNPVSMAQRDVR